MAGMRPTTSFDVTEGISFEASMGTSRSWTWVAAMAARAGSASAATTTSFVGMRTSGSSVPWLLSMNAAAPAARASRTPTTSTSVRRRLLSLNSISMVAGS